MQTAVQDSIAIALQDLSFEYELNKPVLNIKSFTVSRGERMFLYGPSGSGKSTLLGILAGILQANSGTSWILGQDFSKLKSSQRDLIRGQDMGYIFQMFNLVPYLSVLENITLACDFTPSRCVVKNSLGLVDEAVLLARSLGIESLLAQNVSRLSVGQQQRVAAARALMGSPKLIIADEPTSALDTDHRVKFLELLFQECQKKGSTLVFVSHDLTLMNLFDRVVSLADINSIQSENAYDIA